MYIMTSHPRTRILSRPHLVIENQIMAALDISISSDSSDESVGSSILRVILFGSIHIEVPVIPIDLPVAPNVGAGQMLSLTCRIGDIEGILEFSVERDVSSAPHDAMVARWRSRVASRPSSPLGSSSPTTFTSEIPNALILPAPPTIDAPSTDIISPFDAPLGGFDHKEYGWYLLYFSSLGIEVRIASFRSFYFRITSDHLSSDYSSSDHSTADYSLFGHSTSDQTLSGHTSPVTTIGDSSTPSRFIYLPPTRT
ncbi:hypothetical protein Tco_1440715 [Tanacetum coccineum]